MPDRPGRNDPCPCGSGKKYKKCCGAQETLDFSIPDHLKTGTLLDEYMMLIQGLNIFSQTLRQFDDDRRAINSAIQSFEEEFSPGEDHGVPDNIYMSWLLLDFRFGKSQKTVGERFLESGYADKLRDPAPVLLKNLRDSYIAFYQVKTISDEHILFEEIGTNRQWRARRVNEPYERETMPGDIWYVRLLGDPAESYILTAPYIFPPDGIALSEIREGMDVQKRAWIEYAGVSVGDEDTLRQSCKASVCTWLRMILGKPPQFGQGPVVSNTDREPLRFSIVYFKILNSGRLLSALSGIQGFEYDESNKQWVWLKKTKRNIKMFSTTVGGIVKIEGSALIAETNSLNRALKIKDMIEKALGSDVAYEKIESKDRASMPPLTKQQHERLNKETDALNADPQVRDVLQRQAHEYYHKSWLRQKIPALGFKTPYEAVKSAEGKKQVAKLLDDFETAQNMKPENAYRVDIDSLRRKLKLI